jgi:hypothetical protein
MKIHCAFAVLLFTFLLPFLSEAQPFRITGTVIDERTAKPLAFVNIIADNQTNGTTTDIDGKFSLVSNAPFQTLSFSYVGYEPLTITLSGESSLEIKLFRKAFQLQEAVVFPGENPAHRIIRNVTANRNKNNPEQLKSFSYVSYNKMYFTLDTGSAKEMKGSMLNPKNADSLDEKEVQKFIEEQYIMLMEFVSKREYKYKGRNNEKVIASRISGFKNPDFTALGTQMQSFSFYDDYFNLGQQKFLNPVSEGSTSKYFFLLEDTLYSGNDSIFIISYKAFSGKNFDALNGLLYITTDGWAIQNVIAEATDAQGVGIKIQQQYEKLQQHWFPVKLNTDILAHSINLNGYKLKGVGRTYLDSINIEQPVSKKNFRRVELDILPTATRREEEFWNLYRKDTLIAKETKTYHVIDSLGKQYKFDLRLKALMALLTGKIPIRFIDLDLNRIIAANTYEAVRLGVGIHTNDRISRFFNVGGYFGYGFRDKGFKYGADATVIFHKESETALKLNWFHDIPESGKTLFALDRRQTFTEAYRQYYIGRRDLVDQYEATFTFRLFQYLKVQLAGRKQYNTPTDEYLFGKATESVTAGINRFEFTEAELGFKFAFREKFLRTGRMEFSTGTKFPVVWLTVTKGFNNLLAGMYDYWKIDAKIEKSFFIKSLGKESIQLMGGIVTSDVPYAKLFNGKGSFQKYPVATENSFETMGMNEFLASKYVVLFHKHDFGSLLFRYKKFRPDIVLLNNIGFGYLSNTKNHFNRSARSFEHGYFETGIALNNILRVNLLGLGASAHYRYGGYQNAELIDNVAFKVTMSIALMN